MPKSAFLFLILSLALLFPLSAQAQHMLPGQMDTLRGIPQDMHTMVRRSPAFQYGNSQRAAGGGATFNVTYTGFTAPAQAAFQYAVDIWASQLVSDVPIEVEATFEVLGPGVLGSAGPATVFANFANAPMANTFYPVALANSLAGCDLDISGHDITARFNSNLVNWYFGTNGVTPPGQFDFVSVVLHELGHGLGFTGSENVDAGGLYSIGIPATYFPLVYDQYVVNGTPDPITSFTNFTAALEVQLTSNNLFSNAPTAVAANAAANVKLYLPATFDPGSSYSHWDDATFPAGNPHSLMTHAIGTAEAIHDPGDITRGLFEDMGWKLANQAEAKMQVRTVWFSDLAPLPFSDCSILATSWAWDFDNNGTVESTVQNPTYTYPAPGNYTARLTINGNPALTTTQAISIGTSPTLPYVEDFESGDGNYYAYPIAGCDGGWQHGASNSANFNGAFATIGGAASWATELTGHHGFNTRYALEMPPLDLSNPTHDYVLEFDYRAACGTDAGFNLEYSTDGGNVWTTLGAVGDPNATNWYTDAALAGLDGEPGFRQVSFAGFHPTYLLNFLFGNVDVRIRFKFGAEDFANDGIQIDNVVINGVLLNANHIALRGAQVAAQIDLHWTLAAPEAAGRAAIERLNSHDGVYLSIGQIPAAASQLDFHFTDARPLPGANVYRIRHDQPDGGYFYSEAIELHYEPVGGMALYPNPAQGSVWLRIDAAEPGSVSLSLFDLSGKLRVQRQWQASGPFEEQVALPDLPAGLYLYELKSRTGVLRSKLLVE